MLPGGCIEPDEYPAERLIAEMREETGLDVRPIELVGIYGVPGCRILYPNGDQVSCVVTLFACEIVGGSPTADGEESFEVAFFSEDELRSLNVSHRTHSAHSSRAAIPAPRQLRCAVVSTRPR